MDLRGTMLTAQCATTRMLAADCGRLVTVHCGNIDVSKTQTITAVEVGMIPHRHAMDQVASGFGSQFGSPTIITGTATCIWPAKTVGAGGFEPPAPRL